jgi:hypothetical protein
MADAYRSSMMILSTKRCPHRCKFCPYHGDKEHITEKRPSVKALAKETRDFCRGNEAVERNNELYIVNSGSILDERQIPREYLSWLAGFLDGKGLDLVLECRADSKLEECAAEIEELRDAANSLTFAIGVEAKRDDMGDELFKRLRKGITTKQCIEQAQRFHDLGCMVKAYTIIAPPWLGGPSFLKKGYRKSIDWLIETAFHTTKFEVDDMKVEIIGISPFFPYKHTNEKIPEDWCPISATESAEVANQLRQVTDARIDFTSRQIHFPYGNFWLRRGEKKPVDANDHAGVLKARENVARICKRVFGKRGEISRDLKKNNQAA